MSLSLQTAVMLFQIPPVNDLVGPYVREAQAIKVPDLSSQSDQPEVSLTVVRSWSGLHSRDDVPGTEPNLGSRTAATIIADSGRIADTGYFYCYGFCHCHFIVEQRGPGNEGFRTFQVPGYNISSEGCVARHSACQWHIRPTQGPTLPHSQSDSILV